LLTNSSFSSSSLLAYVVPMVYETVMACPHLLLKTATLYPETGDFVAVSTFRQLCCQKRQLCIRGNRQRCIRKQAILLPKTATFYPETGDFVAFSGDLPFSATTNKCGQTFRDHKFDVMTSVMSRTSRYRNVVFQQLRNKGQRPTALASFVADCCCSI